MGTDLLTVPLNKLYDVGFDYGYIGLSIENLPFDRASTKYDRFMDGFEDGEWSYIDDNNEYDDDDTLLYDDYDDYDIDDPLIHEDFS